MADSVRARLPAIPALIQPPFGTGQEIERSHLTSPERRVLTFRIKDQPFGLLQPSNDPETDIETAAGSATVRRINNVLDVA